MERAIMDLCQRSDANLCHEVATGIRHVLEVVDELEAAAVKLLQTDEFYRPQSLENYPAKVLRNLAQEEAAKVLILLDVVRCPKNKRSRPLRYFYDHIAKGIYSHVCYWRLGQFKEVERAIRDRTDPEGTFPNDIRYFREYDMYVNYMRDDSRGANEVRHQWTVPNRQIPIPDCTSLVVDVARALHKAGVTTEASLAVLGEIWRPVEVSELEIDELQRLNRKTLDILRQRGLLADAPDEIYERIMYYWPFPLWSLELSEREIDRCE